MPHARDREATLEKGFVSVVRLRLAAHGVPFPSHTSARPFRAKIFASEIERTDSGVATNQHTQGACFIDRASNIVMPPPNLYHDPQHSQPGPIHKIGGGNDGAELGLYCHHGSPCHRHVCVQIRRSFVRGRCHPGRMPATPRMVILKTNVFGVMRHTYWTCGPPWAPVHLEVWSDE